MNAVKMAFACSVLLMSAAGFAQSTNCDEGAGTLNPAQPQKLTTQEIIEKFAGREAIFATMRSKEDWSMRKASMKEFRIRTASY